MEKYKEVIYVPVFSLQWISVLIIEMKLFFILAFYPTYTATKCFYLIWPSLGKVTLTKIVILLFQFSNMLNALLLSIKTL